MRPIYIDLDETLGTAVYGPFSMQPSAFEVRPEALWFLEALSRYGDLHLLTWAEIGWVKTAFRALGPHASLFKGVISREALLPVAMKLDAVDGQNLPEAERLGLYKRIRPIAPPGVAFDDFPVGSRFYRIKTLAVGTFFMGPHLWIQVTAYESGTLDDSLRLAYDEFQRRNRVWQGRSGWPGMGGMRPINLSKQNGRWYHKGVPTLR